MSDVFHAPARLSPLAPAAIGLGVALIVLFVICAVVAIVAPGLSETQAWIGLFTTAPVASLRAWIEGLVFSAAFGAVAGAVFVWSYNAVLNRAA